MNLRERFLSIMDFEPSDRTVLWEWGYWGGTIERWYAEGLPRLHGLREPVTFGGTVAGPGAAWGSGVLNVQPAPDVSQFCQFDPPRHTIPLENFIYPAFEERVVAEEGDRLVVVDGMGVTLRKRKDDASLPEFLAWPVANREDWERLKAERFQVRIHERLPANWPELVQQYRQRDYPLAIASGYCGFFGSLRALMGEVNLFYAYYDQPDLIRDILNFLTDFWIEIYGYVLQRRPARQRRVLGGHGLQKRPAHLPGCLPRVHAALLQKLIGFLRENGVRHFCVDTDGDCWSLIPLFLEAGMTGMLPFEVQAGMDIVAVRQAFPRLQIYGGIDKRALAKGKEAIDRELEAKVPALLRQGGYIPFADHLVHPEVSWENFVYYRRRLAEMAGREE